jgi:hypothetical protein
MKATIGDATISIPVENIRERYTDKTVFVSEMLSSNAGIFNGEKAEKAFKKALDTAWKEAFPDKKDVPKDAVPTEETNEEAPI